MTGVQTCALPISLAPWGKLSFSVFSVKDNTLTVAFCCVLFTFLRFTGLNTHFLLYGTECFYSEEHVLLAQRGGDLGSYSGAPLGYYGVGEGYCVYPLLHHSPCHLDRLVLVVKHNREYRRTAVGGVNAENAKDFLSMGFVGVGVGSNLYDKKLVKCGDLDGLTALAKKYTEALK